MYTHVFQEFTGKPILVLDLDDVLRPTVASALAWYNKEFSTDYLVDQRMSAYSYRVVWGCTLEEEMALVDRWYKEASLEMLPILGAVEGLKELVKRYDVVIATSTDRSYADGVIDWIDRHFPNQIMQVCLLGYFHYEHDIRLTKGQLAVDLNAKVAIDDLPYHISTYAALGVPAVLFGDFPWNTEVVLGPNVQRALNWDQLITLI